MLPEFPKTRFASPTFFRYKENKETQESSPIPSEMRRGLFKKISRGLDKKKGKQGECVGRSLAVINPSFSSLSLSLAQLMPDLGGVAYFGLVLVPSSSRGGGARERNWRLPFNPLGGSRRRLRGEASCVRSIRFNTNLLNFNSFCQVLWNRLCRCAKIVLKNGKSRTKRLTSA